MGELAFYSIFPNMAKLSGDGMRRKNEKKKTQNC
jgi:hypothetical protein